ncbi:MULTISPECIES: hypothetical protein [Streptomycetaceae]|uniref:Uncharacterized protein n=1 Tax=Streptantibioticus cattleyicolor (strain ATCC 35852 / DSM 46488 / JCM 4925 / NBRC 14057 / NRRL 8057) TaxID=1003195 RepID=F8JXC5_STREN|nr:MULTISPECIES: hypothetical protein [Streptomycetaceae]AEW94598.1 hypothetical protein SCATT_22270 [Streptantibioticus cattleyicolor NRRL 8057 = DSM 46488]MYS59236.1 hypothetical protein [Streptomyces sp. SID5468]CCB74955.1 protein of unknown function [Streptantibioticus cattleyicolor NRRL 8057 = DSM 46488]
MAQTQTLYYVGQDVGVTTPGPVLDDTGSAATGTLTVTLTVTDPTGAVTMPAVSSTGGGTYAAVVPSVATAGIWLYRWTATGTGVGWASEGQFTVRPMGVEQLVDLESVKKHLNMPLNSQAQDDELQGYILMAADQARDVCGPWLPEQHTQFFDGGVNTIVPDWLPLASIQSATEYYGLSAFPLTEQQLGSQMNAFAYTVDYSTGQITRRTFGGQAAMFAIGAKNVKIVYTAGRPGSVPYTVRLGALELIRHMWQMTQQGGRPKFGGSAMEGDTAVPTGFALPDRVVELWAPYRRPPGIA